MIRYFLQPLLVFAALKEKECTDDLPTLSVGPMLNLKQLPKTTFILGTSDLTCATCCQTEMLLQNFMTLSKVPVYRLDAPKSIDFMQKHKLAARN